jgi:hypothetical protein
LRIGDRAGDPEAGEAVRDAAGARRRAAVHEVDVQVRCGSGYPYCRAGRLLTRAHPIPSSTVMLPAAGARRRRSGHDPRSTARFFVAFATAIADPTTDGRLSTFLNLYGFCRNVSVAVLMFATCLIVGAALGTRSDRAARSARVVGRLIGVARIRLFHRYLKLFRQRPLKVLIAHAAHSVDEYAAAPGNTPCGSSRHSVPTARATALTARGPRKGARTA